jgi:hypothetical protein
MSGLGNFFSNLISGPDYNKITSESRRLVDIIPAQLNGDIMAIESGYNSDISNSRAGVSSSITSDLSARGISSPEVAKASQANIQSGLSGAYASAHAALMGAKLNAKNKLSFIMSQYYTNLANKQHDAMKSVYAARMGIVGALGIAAGTIIGKKSTKKTIAKNDTDYSETLANMDMSWKESEPFRMKGARDETPLMLRGVK